MEKIKKILNHKIKTEHFMVTMAVIICFLAAMILYSGRIKELALKGRLKEVSKQAIESGVCKDSLKKSIE